ncbi:antibiotic biosynthesis monooxygenase family protein [Massilia rubra]|uniref:Antibiotic biosynthesis monooxygenase n=1 Tax=Massilia rubra TaxID=2607910 RepID=A0ABX0M2Y2_9BURK|nr:antibiotic biosynthesis monooxygenase [Massilia rubra]NHZ36591.1 antibiotic biosynthesis monooxygenase [Massilia rubra]
MYSSTFIFGTKDLDDEFHQLDKTIAEAAKSLPGYLGEEAWENRATGLFSNVYYWDSLEALQALMQHPAHLQAKAAQARWLDGYHVVISEVIRTYGNAELGHRMNVPASTAPADLHAAQ